MLQTRPRTALQKAPDQRDPLWETVVCFVPAQETQIALYGKKIFPRCSGLEPVCAQTVAYFVLVFSQKWGVLKVPTRALFCLRDEKTLGSKLNTSGTLNTKQNGAQLRDTWALICISMTRILLALLFSFIKTFQHIERLSEVAGYNLQSVPFPLVHQAEKQNKMHKKWPCEVWA